VKQPLQIEALLAAVRRQTGLDDFGDETFHEPLSRLLGVLRKRGTPEHNGQMRFNSGHSTTLYQSVAYSARPRRMAVDRGGSDYRAAFIMGLPRTGTGPALNPEEISPLVGRWSRHLADL
jgi:hypothetical protein